MLQSFQVLGWCLTNFFLGVIVHEVGEIGSNVEAVIFSVNQFKTAAVADNLEFRENKIAFYFVISYFVGLPYNIIQFILVSS